MELSLGKRSNQREAPMQRLKIILGTSYFISHKFDYTQFPDIKFKAVGPRSMF